MVAHGFHAHPAEMAVPSFLSSFYNRIGPCENSIPNRASCMARGNSHLQHSDPRSSFGAQGSYLSGNRADVLPSRA